MSRLLVVSPHLDDGVFSCGALLARHPGSVVVTAFAGGPRDGAGVTEWDRASGFTTSADAVLGRRAEDRAALARLGAEPHWLEFPDAQYGSSPDVATLAAALVAALTREPFSRVLLPLGLFHSDHLLTHAAARAALRWVGRPWSLYEEAIYRRYAGLLDERLALLARDGALAPLAVSADTEAKRAAVACYRSQLRALATPGRPGHADVFSDERYWSPV